MIRMQLWRKLELWFWTLLPCFITLAFIVLYLTPKHMAGLSYFMPLLPLIPIFYWGLMHAHEMPFWFVFIAGLLMDAVGGQPLGLSSLLYLFFLAMLHAQRKYILKEGFIIKWAYFGALLGVTSLLNWLLMFFLNGGAQGFFTGLLQCLLTLGFYPLLHKAFDGLSEHIHARRWQILHGR